MRTFHRVFRIKPGTKPKQKRARERGAVVVEAAIITPLFFSLIMAIVEFGPLFFQLGSVKNAVSEGVRLASIDGSAGTADYDTIQSMRETLKNVGSSLDYVIVYKAKNISEPPPDICKQQADLPANRNATSATQAVGVFDAGNFPVTAVPWTVETYNFDTARPFDKPLVACNIYYRRMFDTPKPFWVYDRALAAVLPPATPSFSLDRYFPGSVRVDYQSGPQDFVGVYVQAQYTSPTGMFKPRKIRANGVVRIEPVRANK
jgi:TadE-like protein